jgi:hypothetical protein
MTNDVWSSIPKESTTNQPEYWPRNCLFRFVDPVVLTEHLVLTSGIESYIFYRGDEADDSVFPMFVLSNLD